LSDHTNNNNFADGASSNQNFMTFDTLKTENDIPMGEYQLAADGSISF